MTAPYKGRHYALAPENNDVPPAASGKHTVQAGETLVSIAARYGLNGGWRALYEKNLWLLGGNPNQLMPGQRLAL